MNKKREREKRLSTAEGKKEEVCFLSVSHYFVFVAQKKNRHSAPYDKPPKDPRRGSETRTFFLRHLEETSTLCEGRGGVEEEARVRFSFIMSFFSSVDAICRQGKKIFLLLSSVSFFWSLFFRAFGA